MIIRIGNLAALLFLLSGCSDTSNSGLDYQRVLLAQKGDTNVYCYSLYWASEADYISTNKDVCMGFDSSKDYCYGRGHQEIFYKFENDTLKVYTYGHKPTIPKSRPLNLTITQLDYSLLPEFNENAKNNKIFKVGLESLRHVPCSAANRPFDLMNMRFKK
jgi:hypothetical protein